MNGGNPNEGRLEVQAHGIWGTVSRLPWLPFNGAALQKALMSDPSSCTSYTAACMHATNLPQIQLLRSASALPAPAALACRCRCCACRPPPRHPLDTSDSTLGLQDSILDII